MNFLRILSSIFNIFGNFSDCAALNKCILPALSVIFWPKLVVFDQVSAFFSGKSYFDAYFYVIAC